LILGDGWERSSSLDVVEGDFAPVVVESPSFECSPTGVTALVLDVGIGSLGLPFSDDSSISLISGGVKSRSSYAND
jgi:hypothetical protein